MIMVKVGITWVCYINIRDFGNTYFAHILLILCHLQVYNKKCLKTENTLMKYSSQYIEKNL